MANKLIYIANNDTQHYPFCRLQLQFVIKTFVLTYQNPVKVPKVVKPTNKKRLI